MAGVDMSRQAGSRGATEEGELPGQVPVALCQAVLAAIVICVCEFVVAPVYVAMAVDGQGRQAMALVPMGAMLAALGVAFVYTVGFALLWVGDIVAARIGRPKLSWLVYGMAGLVGFGAWGGLVVPSVLDSITAPLGGAAVSGGNLVSVVVNSAAIGALAFALAGMFADRLRARRTVSIALAVASVLVAAFGVYVMVAVFGRLY